MKELGPIAIAIAGGDNVVAATRTWTFANGNFTQAMVGRILNVSVAVNASNNGRFKILDVTSPTTLITAPLNPLTDEAFVGPTVLIEMDPCWDVGAAVTQIQITFADGTIVQANAADAQELWENIKSNIKQGEMRGITTGGPFKWTFNAKGVDCNQVPEDLL